MRKTVRIFGVLIGLAFAAHVAHDDARAAQGEWIDLFEHGDLTGWKLARKDGPNGWQVSGGEIINKAPSTDILTEKWFQDFDLHVEFNVYPGSNSGLYLLGRYEIQIQDDYRIRPAVRNNMCGALYRQVAPTSNECKPPGEWQTFDIQFRASRFDAEGRKVENGRVTVVLNGVKILDSVELVKPTGSRGRFDEEAWGPILIQGDHGSIRFRNFRVRGKSIDPPPPDAPGPVIVGTEIEPERDDVCMADGVALAWRTPNHAYAPVFRVYRAQTADVPLDRAHLRATAVRRSFSDCDFEEDATYYYRIVSQTEAGRPGPPSQAILTRAKANQAETADLARASWARWGGDNAPRRNRSEGRRTMTIHGDTFDKGIGVRGNSTIRMYVGRLVGNRQGCRLRGTIGLDDQIRNDRRGRAAGRYLVRLDDKVTFDSGVMRWGDGAREIDVPIPAGARKLELIVSCEGPRGWNYSDWADVRVERSEP